MTIGADGLTLLDFSEDALPSDSVAHHSAHGALLRIAVNMVKLNRPNIPVAFKSTVGADESLLVFLVLTLDFFTPTLGFVKIHLPVAGVVLGVVAAVVGFAFCRVFVRHLNPPKRMSRLCGL